MGTANWSEVAQKVIQHGRNWPQARALLLSYDLTLESVTAGDAESAASLWNESSHLSVGDRLCLALALRLKTQVLTADARWGRDDPVVQIR